MANLASNPWSLTSADVVTATGAAANAYVLNADGSVTITTLAANTFAQGQSITVINASRAAYNGFYFIVSITSNTVLVAAPQFAIPAGTAAATGGSVGLNLYNAMIRVEDISWQNAIAAGHTLDLRDRMGNIVWVATATGAGQQNRGKIFWINGLTPFVVQSGVVLMTIN